MNATAGSVWRVCLSANAAKLALLLSVAPSMPAQQTWPAWFWTQVPDSGIPTPATVRSSELAVADDAVYSFWNLDDPLQSLLWARSVDHGRSWSAATRFPPASLQAYRSLTSVLAKDDEVIVNYEEWQPNGYVSMLAVSPDQGTNWAVHPGPLHASPSNLLDANGILLWSSGPWLFSSPDRGASWQGPVRIGLAGANGGLQYFEPRLKFADGVLHAAWTEYPSGGGERAFYARSADRGATWLPAARPLAATTAWTGLVDLICRPGVVILAWSDTSGVRVDRSLDGGATWLPSPSTIPLPIVPSLLCDGDSLIALWQDNTLGSQLVIRCLRSPDLGITWNTTPTDILYVPSQPTSGLKGFFSGDRWLSVVARYRICWSLPCTYAFAVAVSKDGGATWSSAGGQHAGACQGVPNLATDGRMLCGLWQEAIWPGNPIVNAKFDWFAGWRPLGGSAAGSGGRAPRLSLDSVPAFRFDCELRVSDGLPGAAAVVVLGNLLPPVPFLGGELILDPATYCFLPLGTATSPAPGSASLTFRAPYGVASEFAFQAFVLDPAAVGGVAISEGMEVRIY
jgi:hypothetical protein